MAKTPDQEVQEAMLAQQAEVARRMEILKKAGLFEIYTKHTNYRVRQQIESLAKNILKLY